MRVDRRFLNWGAFFIAMGVVMLVADGNLVDDATLAQAWRLWPAVLIVLGVGILLRRTRLNVAGGLLVAVIPGLVLGGMFAVGPRVVSACGGSRPATYTTRQGEFAQNARVDLAVSCGDVTIQTGEGSAWTLETGNTEDVAASVSSSADRLNVSRGHAGRWFSSGRDSWRLTLPTATTLNVSVEVNAGEGTLDFGGARLASASLSTNAGEMHADLTGATLDTLDVSVNAGSSTVRLPASDDFNGTLSANAGSLRVCADPGLGLRVHSHEVLGSATFRGFSRSGDAWESPDYATASHHAELTVSVNLGSVILNPAGGCH